jgi:coenzyme F420-reducing hydrogenase alpha subunit
VGPLARYALSAESLSGLARDAAQEVGLAGMCRNPYRSIVVRAVEILYAVEESLRILETYHPPDTPAVEVRPRAGVGAGWSEAPRGVLWHRYEIDDEGTIRDARIVPPTSQNQAMIEQDLRLCVERFADLPDHELRARCEQTIRNYDPCISCATHFLDLAVTRACARATTSSGLGTRWQPTMPSGWQPPAGSTAAVSTESRCSRHRGSRLR